MTRNALKSLLSEEFVVSLGVCGTASGLRRCLQRSVYVKAVRNALASGELTEKAIRKFVRELMTVWKPGMQFPYDFALAALAVALEKRFTPFADEYLLDLARLQGIAEVDLSPKVAQACRRDWGIQRDQVVERKRRFVKGALATEQVPDFWMMREAIRGVRRAETIVLKATMNHA